MSWESKLKNRVVTRSIDERIDEVLVYKDNDLITHIEEMDSGYLYVIFHVGDQEHRFHFRSNSEIKIIKE